MSMQVLRRCGRGSTLVEVLVACSVFSVFLGVLYGLFVWGLQTWKKADAQMDVDREGVLGLDRLTREMRTSDVGSLQVTWYSSVHPFTADAATPPTGSVAISFQSAYAPAGAYMQDPITLQPVWSGRVIWYHDPGLKTLMRKRIEMATSSLQASPLASPGGVLDGQGDIVATGVTVFQVLDPTGATDVATRQATNPSRIRLVLQKPTSRSNLVETVSLTSLVRMNN